MAILAVYFAVDGKKRKEEKEELALM